MQGNMEKVLNPEIKSITFANSIIRPIKTKINLIKSMTKYLYLYETPAVRYERGIEIDKIDQEYRKQIVKVYTTLDSKDYIDLSFFTHNLESLQIFVITDEQMKADDKEESLLSTGATYAVSGNYINLTNTFTNHYIYHELLHVASSKYTPHVDFSGFAQSDDENDIGNGINEGYTELLTERYFSSNDHSGYEVLNYIASLIEGVIGQEKMEELYFSADLKGLIETLSKYNSKNEIYKFIKVLDIMEEYFPSSLNYENKFLMNKIDFIVSFITNCYAKKIKMEYDMSKEKQKNLYNRFEKRIKRSLTEKMEDDIYLNEEYIKER